jgi:photosystem II stability/assembly factor-like uncharacterized protein
LLIPGFGQRAPAPQWKGIWEPVSYPDDVRFFDVFFATAEEGWAGGGANEVSGGLIVHTADGGDHWDVQYGDPQSSERAISEFRFLDGTHGWAVQRTGSASRLLRTRDGKLWTVAGTIDENHTDYMFTSEATGVSLSKDIIKITRDGGRSWQPVFPCAAKVQVNGLFQNVSCEWRRVHFVSPAVGFAIAMPYGVDNLLFLAKTADGGATWSMTTQELTGKPEDTFFIDENTGYVRVGAADTGQVYKTTDGGRTWTGLATSPGKRMQFADPEVGWALLYRKISFTTDGGNRWNSREYPFPASADAFSLPRRDRGYVAGEHGMIFRYRIVPINYTSKGMIPAPLLSGIDSPLEAQVQQLEQQVQSMVQDLPGAAGAGGFPGGVPGGDGAAPANAAPGDAATAGNPGAPFDAGTPGVAANPGIAFTAPGPAATGGVNSAGGVMGCVTSGLPAASTGGLSPAGGGFAQNTGNATPSIAGAGFAQDTGANGTTTLPPAFTQDTTAATNTMNSVSTTVPQFLTRYRNLNLLLTGFQVSAQMPAVVDCLKRSFQMLKATKDPQASSLLAANMQGQVSGLGRLVRVALQKPK